jgi:hypothetical protein
MFAVDTVLTAQPDVPFDFLTAYVVALFAAWVLCEAFHRWLYRNCPGPAPRRSFFDTLPQLWFIALVVVWIGSAFVDYRPNFRVPISGSGTEASAHD